MELIDRGDRELRRVELAIAQIETRSPSERMRKQVLLEALISERAELKRARGPARRAAPALS
jgi:hypothetical protein